MCAAALTHSAAAGVRNREAQEVAGPSLGLAALVLAFLGFSFSGVEGSQAGVYDIPFSVSNNTHSLTDFCSHLLAHRSAYQLAPLPGPSVCDTSYSISGCPVGLRMHLGVVC